jgi:orotate phosphoribosyltransferase
MAGEVADVNRNAAAYTDEQKILLQDLFQSGAILIGDVVRTRFGLNSPIYFNLRENLYARPELLWRVGREFVSKIRELTRHKQVPQCIVGIPDTAAPLALAAALYAWQNQVRPEITYALLRKEGKAYPGLPLTYWIGKKETNCEYNLIDDVVASGLTKRTAAWKMEKEGIALQRIIVLFDRQQGDGLLADGFELHAIFCVTDVVDFLRANHLIHSEDHQKIVEFLHSKRFDLAIRTK